MWFNHGHSPASHWSPTPKHPAKKAGRRSIGCPRRSFTARPMAADAAAGDPAACTDPDVEAHTLLRPPSSDDEDPEECAFEPAEKIVVSITGDPDAEDLFSATGRAPPF